MHRVHGRWTTWVWAAVALLPWSFVGVTAALPEGPVADRLTHLALGLTTSCAAVVTLRAAVLGGQLRRVWLLLGLGLGGYAGGFLIQFLMSDMHSGPFGLNVSDCSSLLLYPLADAGLLVLARQRAGPRTTGSLLEGGMVFCGVSAVAVAGTAIIFPTLLTGSFVNIVYALAYPVGGLTLLLVTLTGLSLSGGHADRVWVLLLCGFATMTVGDGLYGVASVRGHFHYGTYLDVLYTAGPVFVALAATVSRRVTVTATSRQGGLPAALPGLATIIALAVLVLGTVRMIPRSAIAAAALCVLLAVLRTWQLFAQARSSERSRVLASTDELTSLANRRALLSALEARAHGKVAAGREAIELLLLNLDGFKEVNDSLGHPAGDALLTTIAGRLRATAPGCLVARLGGDDFAVVLPPAKALGGPRLARNLQSAVEKPVLIGATRVVVGVSIGHSLLPATAPGEKTTYASTDPPLPASIEILRRADLALYRSKEQRKGCVSWDAALDQGSRNRLALLGELREALAAADQVVAWFQPKVDPRTLRTTGYEALARWQHPNRGLLLPGEFIAPLERAGLLPALTGHVLRQSLALLRALNDAGTTVQVAVNLAAPDLLDVDLVSRVAGLLERSGVPAKQLRFEVTETVIMTDPERITRTLLALRALGVGLSLDDYGTGLSSLSYLRVLPIDELKIDQSFVKDLLTDHACALIVMSTAQLAHDLNLTVVAEGVEDEATLLAITEAGCDTAQGWHTGRPRPAATVLLEQHAALPHHEGATAILRRRPAARGRQGRPTGS